MGLAGECPVALRLRWARFEQYSTTKCQAIVKRELIDKVHIKMIET